MVAEMAPSGAARRRMVGRARRATRAPLPWGIPRRSLSVSDRGPSVSTLWPALAPRPGRSDLRALRGHPDEYRDETDGPLLNRRAPRVEGPAPQHRRRIVARGTEPPGCPGSSRVGLPGERRAARGKG